MEKEMKQFAAEVYFMGFKDGQIEMRDRVLKAINRKWRLVNFKDALSLITQILKIVNKLKLTTPKPLQDN